jgi:signal transduction histidine kinase
MVIVLRRSYDRLGLQVRDRDRACGAAVDSARAINSSLEARVAERTAVLQHTRDQLSELAAQLTADVRAHLGAMRRQLDEFAIAEAALGPAALRDVANASRAAARLSLMTAHGYQRLLAALIQRTTKLEAAHTELVAASAQLERLVSERAIELERASRDLEAFATTISHDLQAPLRHVRQYLALFIDDAAALGEDRLAPIIAAQHSAVELTAKIEAILSGHRRASSGRA